jgi:pimeloyl-ACP methyl ester carboxylesterase
MTDAKAWEQLGSYYSFNGYRIFYRDSAAKDKPALLLIHGFPSSSWDFEGVWPTLEAKFRLITLDMLGFGFSDKPYWHTYDLCEQADIHEVLLARLKVEKYHVLAHDYGVSVGQELIARDNERHDSRRILSVAFLNGGLFPEMHRPLLLQRLLLSPVGPFLSLLMGRSSLVRSFSKIFGKRTQPTSQFIDQTWRLIRHKRGHWKMFRLIRYIKDRVRNQKRWLGALQSRTIPIRLIVGMVDPISGAHMAQHFKKVVPNADVVELHEIGHYPQVEDPKAVLDAYLHFRS